MPDRLTGDPTADFQTPLESFRRTADALSFPIKPIVNGVVFSGDFGTLVRKTRDFTKGDQRREEKDAFRAKATSVFFSLIAHRVTSTRLRDGFTLSSPGGTFHDFEAANPGARVNYRFGFKDGIEGAHLPSGVIRSTEDQAIDGVCFYHPKDDISGRPLERLRIAASGKIVERLSGDKPELLNCYLVALAEHAKDLRWQLRKKGLGERVAVVPVRLSVADLNALTGALFEDCVSSGHLDS